MSRLYVFGLGSPLGWDQIGWLAADRLRARFADDPSIVVDQLNQPTGLFMHPLSPSDTLIFLDIMLGTGAPGSVRVMTPKDLPNRTASPSSHGIDLHATLQLLDAVIGDDPSVRIKGPTVHIVAIESPHAPQTDTSSLPNNVLAPWVTALSQAAETQILNGKQPAFRADPRSSHTTATSAGSPGRAGVRFPPPG
ncbi:hypothetical protein [Halothiobacillus diazotrophicus]|uniref:hypothetical protein n=1 Tax=Halothiobacillus diazotrophicus TaxID=1860122 RepID=UPI0009EF5217|nr:hypothetical protein [Halothiobacillus diazotrophicus]